MKLSFGKKIIAIVHFQDKLKVVTLSFQFSIISERLGLLPVPCAPNNTISRLSNRKGPDLGEAFLVHRPSPCPSPSLSLSTTIISAQIELFEILFIPFSFTLSPPLQL